MKNEPGPATELSSMSHHQSDVPLPTANALVLTLPTIWAHPSMEPAALRCVPERVEDGDSIGISSRKIGLQSLDDPENEETCEQVGG